MPQIAIGSTVVPIVNPTNGPGINGINAGNSPIYVGPDSTVGPNSASQTLQPQDVLNWPANESLFIVCDPGNVSVFQYSNNGALITKGTLNTNIISGSVEISGDVELAAGSSVAISGPVAISGTVPISGNVGVTGPVTVSGSLNANITNSTIDVAGGVDVLAQHYDVDLLFQSPVTGINATTEKIFFQSWTPTVWDMTKYQSMTIYSGIEGTSTSTGAFPVWLILRWGSNPGALSLTETYYISGNSTLTFEVKGSYVQASYFCVNSPSQTYMAQVTAAQTANTIVWAFGAPLPNSYVNAPGLSNNPGPTSMSLPLDITNFGVNDPHFSFQFTVAAAGNQRFYLPSIRGICNTVVYSSTAVVFTSWGNMASRFLNAGSTQERLMYMFAQNSIPANTEQTGQFVCPPTGLFLDMQCNGATTVSVVCTFQPQ